ncbi:MAG: DUF695 domain-containing protein [Bacteroidota bacterium]
MEVLQPEWDFYFCNVEGKLASIMLDLSLHGIAPLSQRNCLIQVAVDLIDPDERGLTIPSEAEKLFVMEDMLAEQLAQTLQGLYVARSTSDGKRIFYFYAAAMVGFQGIVDEVLGSFSEYSYGSQAFSDPDWAMYTQFLYPTIHELHSILNRRALDQLRAQGMGMDQVHTLHHHFEVENETHRLAILRKAKEKNFRAIKRPSDPASILVLKRDDQLSTEELEKVTAYLLNLAEKHDGVYKGWQAAMMA